MNEPSNAPMLPAPSGFSQWVTVWREAITRPSDQTFARIGLSPNAKASTALLWVFLSSLVNFFLVSLVQGPLVAQVLQNSGLPPEQIPVAAGGGLLTAICGAPVGALISTGVFALAVGIVQLIARMFGGRGTFDQLAYAIAAVVAPFSIVSGLLSLLSAVPYAGFCFGLLGLVAGIYVLVLEVMAVKGVNQFGWGAAAGSLLLPFIVLVCCISVVIGGLFSLLAPEISDTFTPLLTPVP
jgi:hypothetical protein